MHLRRLSPALFLFVILVLLCITVPSTSQAAPAAPYLFTLDQGNGTTFTARQWGDESAHGWETAEGYSIVFDRGLWKWTFAVQDGDGRLVSSYLPVGETFVPFGLAPGARPAYPALHLRPSMKISRELATLWPPPIGSTKKTANVLVILINFKDTKTTYTKDSFSTLLFGTGNHSLKDYYEEVSYGQFSVSAGPGGIQGWYQAANSYSYYGRNDSNDNDFWPGDLVYEAVKAADDAGLDFGPYDQNGDCYVDVVAIVHQGAGEESSGVDNDIWSHRWNLNGAQASKYSSYGEYVTKTACSQGGYIKVNDYIMLPETQDGVQTTMGIFAHEYGHALGLPDLYDTDQTSEGVGQWSLMASGNWNSVSREGDRPGHLDPWSKYKLGWITPFQVQGTLWNTPIYQASSYAYIYQLRTGSPAKGGEYLLVENRQKAGFDEGLPGAGLLIWHIDEGKTDNDMECYPGGPACSSQHYRVSLVQADNRYDLEKNANRGDGGDPYPGTANNTSFNSGSSPNSGLFTGKAGNVSVTSISSSGYMMTATLSASFNASGRALSRVSPIITPLALSGVKMEFYRISGNGMLPRPVLTDRNGNWSQSGFTPGETYMVVPKKQGYTFLPGYIQFTEGNAQGLSLTSNRSFIIH